MLSEIPFPDLTELKRQAENLETAAEIVSDNGQLDDSDQTSTTSDDSDNLEMEGFDTYKSKIEQLLTSIGFNNFAIDSIQHGYGYQNCVYALTSLKNPSEQYILRVAIDGEIRVSDERHETLENDIALLGYLADKLPVPRVKAYSLTTDNILDAAYTIQTRIPGQSLNNLWATMSLADKYAIVDEYLHLLIKMESIKFPTSGTFAIPAPIPAQMSPFTPIGDPLVHAFEPYATEPTQHTPPTGCNLPSFLTSHLTAWIREEISRAQHSLPCSIGPKFKLLLSMLDDIESESSGSFTAPSPIVLHHWDLEPRNIMVCNANASGRWKITGIIDWDDALALPRPLARVPPRWIWDFHIRHPKLEDGFLNADQYADPELEDEDKALKRYFDNMVECMLPGYNEDAYGTGRWLRRIWYFAREGAFKTWEWGFLDQLPREWAARSKV